MTLETMAVQRFALGAATVTLVAPEWLCGAVSSVLGTGAAIHGDGLVRPIRLEPLDGAGERWRLIVPDGEAVAGPLATDELVEAVLTQFTRQTVMGYGDDWFLHAGAVRRDGVAVAAVAPSGTGKSTLSAALLQHGYEYLSDELAWLQPGDLTVRPFPKPLGLDERSRRLLGLDPTRGGDRFLRVAEQGWRSSATRAPLGLVLSLVRRGAVIGPVEQPLSGAGQAAALLVNQLNLLGAPDPLAAVCHILSIAPVVELAVDDLDAAVARIDGLVDDLPDPVSVVDHLDLAARRPSDPAVPDRVGPSRALGPFVRVDPAARVRGATFSDGSAIVLNCDSGQFAETDATGLRLVASAGSGRSISEVARSEHLPTAAAISYFEAMWAAGVVVPDLGAPS